MVNIDTNIAFPERKKALRIGKRQKAVFKAYAEQFARLYIAKPTCWQMDGDIMLIKNSRGDTIAAGSEKRIKQLTANMRTR